MKMNYCTPELPVSDIESAVEALRLLGFKKAWTFEDVFACMFGDGDIEIFLRKTVDVDPVTLYFKVDDADAFHELYKQHVEIMAPIHDTPWGMREFEARVIDGHVFRIGHGQPEGEDRRDGSDEGAA
ncbi:MAG: hypothetical protein JJ957_17150 [Pseudomonadales bacterium]|nr:hypothetical protein [Pseudomonadales bacterium]MBO6597324.1 hypothetical protein [Pseudomonadales bacterium]MBO6824058.1 hypothetical protein [Pseudomonadales bacterium]